MKFKTYLFAALLAGSTAMAQSIAVNTNDAATGTRIILTKNHKGTEIRPEDSIARNGGLAFFSAGYQNTMVNNKPVQAYFIDLDLFHNNDKLGCITQSGNNLLLTLEDGSEIQCFQMSDTDCANDAYKAAFALTTSKGTFTQMEENFKKLQTVGIKKIKVTTTEGSLNYKIESKSTDYIKAHFALVAKTQKGAVN